MIKIGWNVKRLRGERDVTQEALASALGVTPQAISRWESGNGYPDIEYLPALADFFAVTTDELLGYKLSEREETLKSIKKEQTRLIETGTADERIALLRNALISYPSDCELKSYLADALYCKWDQTKDNALYREIESLCNWLLENTKDVDLTYNAVETLCWMYGASDRTEKSLALINQYLWPMKYCRETVLSTGIGDGKISFYIQDHIDKLTDGLGIAMRDLALQQGGPSEWDKTIEMLNTANSLYLTVYGENLMFHHNRLAWNYGMISMGQMIQGKPEEAIASLEKLLSHTLAYDDSKKHDRGKYFTSIFTDLLTYPEPDKDFHGLERNQAFYMLERLQNNVYDPIRTDARFVAIVNALEQTAE